MKHNETQRGYALIGFLGVTALVFLMLVSTVGAAPYAYIPHSDINDTNPYTDVVSVIDVETDTVVATLSIDSNGGVAFSPDGTKVYVADSFCIYVIDTATKALITKIDIGDYDITRAIAVSPDGNKIYVNNGTICVIDTATYEVIDTVNAGFCDFLVVSQDGTKLYAAEEMHNNITVIDMTTNTFTSIVVTDSWVRGLKLSPDGTKVYVASSRGISVINTTTNNVTSITLNQGGYINSHVAVTPDGDKLYVAYDLYTQDINDSIYVVDTSNYNVTGILRIGQDLSEAAVTPNGEKLYVVDTAGAVYVINTSLDTVIATVPVEKWPKVQGQFIGGDGSILEGTNLCLSYQAPESKTVRSSMIYYLHFTNLGNLPANNVILEDKLPDEVEFESASDGGVYDSSTKTVMWDIGSVVSRGHGYRTLNVSIPEDVPVGTIIVNNANISTSDPEVQYNDNKVQAKTSVTGLILPPNVGVEPTLGEIGTPSVYWMNPITFSYHNTGLPVTGVNTTIHFDDGLPDITDTMTNVTDNMSDWTYTTTFYPTRHGLATVTYTKQLDPYPYTTNYDIRGHYGDKVTADEIYNYIKFLYPQSPMLSEPDIGSRFINSAKAYGIDPIFLVSIAEFCSQFGTVGWGADHPEAHNAFMYGVYGNNTVVDQVNSASSWGDMVNRVACAIATGPNYFTQGRYTIEAICLANDTVFSTQTLSTSSPTFSTQTLSTSSPTQAALDGLIGINYIDTATGVGTGIHILEAYAKTYGVPLPPQLEEIALLTFGIEITEALSIKAIGPEKTEEMKDLINGLVDTRAIIDYAQRWAIDAYSLIFPIYVDPAGYIYDVDTGQRISGAYVWLQRPDDNGDWQNVSTGENPPVSQPDTNPLISDQDGMYQWDTLPGTYRVHVEATGYEPADSIVVSVPPPVFDLHVGLNHTYDPDVPPILPVANFSNDISSGYVPLSVQFADLSENATGISWDFGDGTSSTDRYPIHTYSTAGTYTVTLTASNGNGVNSKTGTIDVQAVPIYPVASFICNTTEGYAPLSVQFTDLSENVNGIKWEFGDGTNSTDQSPVHTYFVTGNYIATLTVSNDNGTSSSFARINVSEHHVTPPQSISNLQSSAGSTWINWTWTNPSDPDFNHTEIYLNNIFQTNTSLEYFNVTGLEPETSYTIGTRTVDNYGNVNETWVNDTATTEKVPFDTFEISLFEGWNLISVPLLPEDTTISSVMSPISGNYSIVWAYDAAEGGVWKMYDPTAPIFVNDLTEIQPGKGYWIMMTANDTLPVNGTLQDNSFQLESGWNLIGYNSLSSKPIDSALAPISGNYSIVWAYDAGDGGVWKMYDPTAPIFVNDLTEMEPGRGYWIMVN
jgi:uncharacterized repeat protein (TIGR01451 family)